MKRTIVLFVDHEPRLSGAERNLVELIEDLDRSRFDIHLAVPAHGPLPARAAAAGATVHVAPVDPALLRVSRWELARSPVRLAALVRSSAKAVVAIARVIRRVDPDIVHTNSQKAHLLAAPATILGRRRHVWHVQDILEDGWLLRVVRLVAWLSASRVICLSEATAAPLRTRILRRRVRVVYSGVRQDAADAAEAARWRDALGLPTGRRLIGIVGQLAAWKGQDVVLDALPKVLAAGTDVHLVVVGACLFPENEAAYERRLNERVDELGLGGRVTFTGAVEPIGPVMAALDVCVHASRLPEPFGRVIVEAMAQGTPVVTTSIGAGPELVPPAAGAHVPPGDTDSLARALVDVLAGDLAAAGAAARAAAARFTTAATRDGVLAVYAELGC